MLTLCYIVERIETCLLLQGVEVGMGDLLSWVLFCRRTNLADFVDRSLESNSWFFSNILFPTQSVHWVYNMYYSWNVYGDILETNMKGCSMCLRLYNNKNIVRLQKIHFKLNINCLSIINLQLSCVAVCIMGNTDGNYSHPDPLSETVDRTVQYCQIVICCRLK